MHFSTTTMKSKRRESQTLSHVISNVLSVAPDSVDSDDGEGSDIRVDEIYDLQLNAQEICPSKLRKQNSHLLEQVDKKYVGTKNSRQNVGEGNEWEILNCNETTKVFDRIESFSVDDSDCSEDIIIVI
ncbi:hypothetical protein AMK59_456 [Oryctes borbonicus]|uniref:Uncharacterized protein n=1 Tax=Oryctes borbonicus TaxID=1629725 RepID=A0A0T6BDY2_9SCAR|nr:hypothetical protein AMK59_456 [Oryctes borbonicus]